jgi:hypothetical protein
VAFKESLEEELMSYKFKTNIQIKSEKPFAASFTRELLKLPRLFKK